MRSIFRIASLATQFAGTGRRSLCNHNRLRIGILLLAGITNWFPAHAYELMTNRVVVKFSDPELATQTQLSNDLIGELSDIVNMPLSHLRRASGQNQIIQLPDYVSLDKARVIAGKLAQSSLIVDAQADRRYLPQFMPDDSEYGNQWYLFESIGGINAETAWDVTRGSTNTVIAVLDTGILNHGEFANRLLAGYDFISDTAIANDGGGRDDDPSDPGDAVAADECFDGNRPENSSWHGTFVTGIIAANADNATGIAGIDHQTRILPVRVLGKCGGFSSDVADAIRWSAGINDVSLPSVNNNPAHIINMSFGALGECSDVEQQAINDAFAEGALMITSAGNDSTTVDQSVPANCENVMTVAGLSRQGAETIYTNFGTGISISAPGGNNTGDANGIYSTFNAGLTAPGLDAFGYGSGTSFAAPMVSAAAGLIRATDTSLGPNDIRFILQSSARTFPTGTSDGFADCTTDRCGPGILDIGAAVGAAREGVLGGAGDGTVRLAQAAACVTENSGSITLNATRIDGSGNISILLETHQISAVPGRDYTEYSEILSWSDGELGDKPFTINVTNDTAIEGAEFLSVRINKTSFNVILGNPVFTNITILSDDGSAAAGCGNATSDDPTGSGSGLWLLCFAPLLLRSKNTKYC